MQSPSGYSKGGCLADEVGQVEWFEHLGHKYEDDWMSACRNMEVLEGNVRTGRLERMC